MVVLFVGDDQWECIHPFHPRRAVCEHHLIGLSRLPTGDLPWSRIEEVRTAVGQFESAVANLTYHRGNLAFQLCVKRSSAPAPWLTAASKPKGVGLTATIVVGDHDSNHSTKILTVDNSTILAHQL